VSTPAIITAAITGAIPTKRDNPAVPIAVAEQVESAHEAFEAGATVCHIHVRDDEQRPSSDPERFRAVQAGLRRHCPGMIVQFSTGARGRPQEERAKPLELRPDMASLATGSVNFPQQIYDNPPSLVDHLAGTMLDLGIKPEIEVFDLAMLYAAADLLERGLIRMPVHVQLVLGIRNALPARESLVDFFAGELQDVLPNATWTCAGIGRAQLDANRWSLARGGHQRSGLEDNLYLERGRLARSNAELVARSAELCADYDRRPATTEEARALLGVRSLTAKDVVERDGEPGRLSRSASG
jgi:3-keto-5-aminohexanoate cleavage enzyme